MQPAQEELPPRSGYAPGAFHVQDRIPTAHVIQQGQAQYASCAVPYPHPAASQPMQQTHHLLPALTQALGKLHEQIRERFEKAEASLKDLSDKMAAAQEMAHTETAQLAQWLEHSHVLQVKATQNVFGRVQKLDELIGHVQPANAPADASVSDRLRRIECVLQELLEKTTDPEAPQPVVPHEDKAVGTSPRLSARDLVEEGTDPPLPHVERTYVETGIDAPIINHAHVSVDASSDAKVDVGPSTTQSDHADAAVDTHTPSHKDMGVGSPASYPVTVPAFGKGVLLHTRFPSAPFASSSMAPAAWSESSDTGTASPGANTPDMQTQILPGPSGDEAKEPAGAEEAENTAAVRPAGIRSEPDLDDLVLFGTPPPPTVVTPSAKPADPPAPSPSASLSTLNNGSPHASAVKKSSRLSTASFTSGSTLPAPKPERGSSATLAPAPASSARLPLPRNIKDTSSPTRGRSHSLSSLSSLASTPTSQPLPRVPTRVASQERENSPDIVFLEYRPAPANATTSARRHVKRRGKSTSVNQDKSQNQVENMCQGQDQPPRKRRKTEGDVLVLKRGKKRGRAPKKAESARGRSAGSAGMNVDVLPLVPAPAVRTAMVQEVSTCKWPDKALGAGERQREFVQCDNCDAWYHFGCVGLAAGDLHLESDAMFYCPPCEESREQRERRHGMDICNPGCGRPDCDHKGQASETNEYFVERIIGRRPHELTNEEEPTEFLWLVKWDGYKAIDATWTLPCHLGDCSKFIEEFEDAAILEDRDLNDPFAIVVLNEAAAVGW